jgi:DNA-binding response OmpR family regulator
VSDVSAVAGDDSSAATHADQLVAGDVTLNRAAYLVTVAGRPLTLARQEFRLLELLMENADHVVTSAAILSAIWGPGYTGDPSTLAVHMLRLRNKLERTSGGPRHLRTVRGIGYVFDTTPV